MTTSDQASGRAATPRFGSSLLTRLLGAALLCAAALPVFAQQAPQLAQAAALTAPSATNPASTSAFGVFTPVNAMPLPDRALMVAGDINRWMGAKPSSSDAAPLLLLPR